MLKMVGRTAKRTKFELRGLVFCAYRVLWQLSVQGDFEVIRYTSDFFYKRLVEELITPKVGSRRQVFSVYRDFWPVKYSRLV